MRLALSFTRCTRCSMRDSIKKALRWALIPALTVYVAALGLSDLAGIDSQKVLRDLAQTCSTPAGVGLLSNLCYLLWLAASAVALFTAYSGLPGIRGKQKELLACGGWFSLILCVDDMFLLHDRYIGQTFLYLIYIMFSLLIATRYRKQLMQARENLPSFSSAVGHIDCDRFAATSRARSTRHIHAFSTVRRRCKISRHRNMGFCIGVKPAP